MTPTDLTGTERAVLIVLMAESRPVANPELATLGPALDKPGRDKLNALGLIESERIKGRYVHELTDRGWALCRDIVAAGPPPRSTGPAKTLYTVLGALGRYLQRSEVSLAELFWPAEAETSEDETPGRETLEDRVRAAYARLAPRPGAPSGQFRGIFFDFQCSPKLFCCGRVAGCAWPSCAPRSGTPVATSTPPSPRCRARRGLA